jgi:hypothetical protein
MVTKLLDNSIATVLDHGEASYGPRYHVIIHAFADSPYGGTVYGFRDDGRPHGFEAVATDGIKKEFRPLAEEYATMLLLTLLG